MNSLYNYLNSAKKVYLVERKKVLTWKSAILFLLSSYYNSEDLVYANFLVKGSNNWEIIITFRGRIVEKIELEDNFNFSTNFVFKKYKYKVHDEITNKLYQYITYL